MGILIAFTKNDKAKVKAVGKTPNLMTVLVAISTCLSERISKEKGVGLDEAEKMVFDCIKGGMKTIEE